MWMNQPLPFHDHAHGRRARPSRPRAARAKGLEAARQDVREQHRARRAPTSRSTRARSGSTSASSRRTGTIPRSRPRSRRTRRLANAVGANGTPTFFINGRELVGAQPFDAFEKIIDEEIKKADELIKKGTPLKDVYKKLIEQAARGRRRRAARGRAGGARGQARHQARRRAGQGAERRQGHRRRVQRLPVPVLLARRCPRSSRSRTSTRARCAIAFKQLPLPFHDKAHLAAEAALAANEQGKFWEMHDKLFANQQALDRPSLEKYAAGAGPQHGQVQGGARLRQVQGQGRRATPRRARRSAPPARRRSSSTAQGSSARSPFDAFKTVIDDELQGQGCSPPSPAASLGVALARAGVADRHAERARGRRALERCAARRAADAQTWPPMPHTSDLVGRRLALVDVEPALAVVARAGSTAPRTSSR